MRKTFVRLLALVLTGCLLLGLVACTPATVPGGDDPNQGNTGNENTGNENSGNENTGNENTGNENTGNENTGNENTGNENTGNENGGNDTSSGCGAIVMMGGVAILALAGVVVLRKKED